MLVRAAKWKLIRNAAAGYVSARVGLLVRRNVAVSSHIKTSVGGRQRRAVRLRAAVRH